MAFLTSYEPGALENNLAQSVDELSERKGADEGLERAGKAPGGEEDAGEQPHRQHDQVHQAADSLGGGGAAADEQADPGERKRTYHVDHDHQGQVAADRHVEHERAEQEKHGQVGDHERQPCAQKRQQKIAPGIGVATNRLRSLAIRKFTTRKPIPQSPPPMALSPIKPGIRKSM